MGLAASLEQERAARMAASGEVAAAEAAARAAAAERDARARDLHAVRTALHDTSEKLAAASAERDMHCARVSVRRRCPLYVMPTWAALIDVTRRILQILFLLSKSYSRYKINKTFSKNGTEVYGSS